MRGRSDRTKIYGCNNIMVYAHARRWSVGMRRRERAWRGGPLYYGRHCSAGGWAGAGVRDLYETDPCGGRWICVALYRPRSVSVAAAASCMISVRRTPSTTQNSQTTACPGSDPRSSLSSRAFLPLRVRTYVCAPRIYLDATVPQSIPHPPAGRLLRVVPVVVSEPLA